MHSINLDNLSIFKETLENHPVYTAINDIDDLRCFMEHHVYSVWDFMSLIKYLQSIITPCTYPWHPQGNPNVRRFINELVLEEESDATNINDEFSSHFELYQRAMQEVGAHLEPINHFTAKVQKEGIQAALASAVVPKPACEFTATTFAFIESNQAHAVAAALALGREHIIPCMFRAILEKLNISAQQAPIFHFYLNRHIHLDTDFHAPLSLQLLNELCAGDTQKIAEATQAAHTAIHARVAFWDGVLAAINTKRT